MHPLKPTRSILDPVHGLIRLTEEELDVINSQIFQRLRRIKQNGLLNYVFPAASHSRFEHSVGVLCVAESMLQALISNGEVAAAKGTSEAGPKALDAVSLSRQLSKKRLASLFRIVRLSALCHDLGHGPLSHTFEKFAPERLRVSKMLVDSGDVIYRKLGEAILKDSSHRIDHEWMSCILFAALFRTINARDKTTPLAVAAAIRNAPELVADKEMASLVPLMHNLIASAPADADRMDYVERDSRSCGVTYGLFDRSRVLKSLLPYLDEKRRLRLGIKSSGFRAVENFIQARFELFVQVYYHKTNRAIELMLRESGAIAKGKNLKVVRDGSLTELLDDYASIGDDEFLDMLNGRRRSQISGVTEIHALARDVGKRRLWRRVEDFREALIPRKKENELFAKLKKAHPGVQIMKDSVEPKATKELDGGAALLFRGADGVYRSTSRHSWTEISHLISAMAKQEKEVVRIYYKGNDPTIARALRMTALKLEHEFRARGRNDRS
jgi:uncharacterized protein